MSTVDSYSIKSYVPHICEKWRKFYFDIDKFESDVDAMRRSAYSQEKIDALEAIFCEEIMKVGMFLTRTISDGQNDLNGISNGWLYLSQNERDALQSERTLVRALRVVYVKSNELMNFYEFNCFLICKVAKQISLSKINKAKGSSDELNSYWQISESHQIFSSTIAPRKYDITALTSRCSTMMSELCGDSFPLVAEGQLKFGQATEIDTKTGRGYLGAKLGFSFALVRLKHTRRAFLTHGDSDLHMQ
jgi:hypothetical protein